MVEDSVLVQDFLAKNNVTSLEHPHTLLTKLQLILPFLPNKSPLKGGAILMTLTSLRMSQKSRKVFHKMASRNVSNNFIVSGRSV